MYDDMSRRRMLVGTGVAGAALLAGCTDDGENDGDSMDGEGSMNGEGNESMDGEGNESMGDDEDMN